MSAPAYCMLHVAVVDGQKESDVAMSPVLRMLYPSCHTNDDCSTLPLMQAMSILVLPSLLLVAECGLLAAPRNH